MSALTPKDLDRLRELLADEALGQLSIEDVRELGELRTRPGAEGVDVNAAAGALLLALDDADRGAAGMPADVRARVAARGVRLVGAGDAGAGPAALRPRRTGFPAWVGIAAGLAVAGAAAFIALNAQRGARAARETLAAARAESERLAAELGQRVRENEVLLASARGEAERLRAELASATGEADRQRALAAAESAKSLELAERLALATSDLDQARLAIAKYETPIDPAAIAASRTKLLEVPGTVRVAWKPFDLPDNPAEQRQVAGDVVWNDELQQGYLRFVGLKVNDPSVEQYQVWLIDERGMEQKVGGGVFNASAEGEIVVPIDPGIDVGRVALFAITIENPGGTWVPDLKRRVVVAPREQG